MARDITLSVREEEEEVVVVVVVVVVQEQIVVGNPMEKWLPASVVSTQIFNRLVNPQVIQCVHKY